MKREPKAKTQRRHFKRRIKERFGLVVNGTDYRKIVAMIQDGSATFIEKQSNTRRLFRLVINKQAVYIVYDKLRKTAVTALTEEMFYELRPDERKSMC